MEPHEFDDQRTGDKLEIETSTERYDIGICPWHVSSFWAVGCSSRMRYKIRRKLIPDELRLLRRSYRLQWAAPCGDYGRVVQSSPIVQRYSFTSRRFLPSVHQCGRHLPVMRRLLHSDNQRQLVRKQKPISWRQREPCGPRVCCWAHTTDADDYGPRFSAIIFTLFHSASFVPDVQRSSFAHCEFNLS